MLQKYTIFFVFFEIVHCVPPTPVINTADFSAIKISLKTLTEQFEKWTTIYNSQIEPRIVSSGTSLTSIDLNVKNLQEKAHIWDTFQLHVAAWNEQLSTSDRKLDIISKAQEKVMELEEKLNSITNFEAKFDEILKKLESIDERLDDTNKKLEYQSQYSAGLFGEFAARGILSTLKVIERKMDKIQLINDGVKQKLIKNDNGDAKGKLTIKCNTPPIIEELLHDVSSKVDVIFDKSGGKCEEDDLLNEDYLEDEQNDGNEKDEQDIKLIKKVLRRFNQPCKNSYKALDRLSLEIKNLSSSSISYQCPSNDNLYLNLTNYLQEIAENITSSIQKQIVPIKKPIECQVIIYDNSSIQKKLDDSYFNDPENMDEKIVSNISNCDDLPSGSPTGIYRLEPKVDIDETNFYTRFCEIRTDGSWTVIQRRGNYKKLQNFTLNWQEYKRGFGDLSKDFWFGNENLFMLSQDELILRIELWDFEGNSVWAEYSTFEINSEEDNYQLIIGDYIGNASDALSSHNGSFFSTFDKTNDDAPECCPCSNSYGGGWWFNSCFEANLNGIYYRHPLNNGYYRGIIWEKWLGNYSLKSTKMMVKQKKKQNAIDDLHLEKNSSYFLVEDP